MKGMFCNLKAYLACLLKTVAILPLYWNIFLLQYCMRKWHVWHGPYAKSLFEIAGQISLRYKPVCSQIYLVQILHCKTCCYTRIETWCGNVRSLIGTARLDRFKKEKDKYFWMDIHKKTFQVKLLKSLWL